MTTDEFDEFCEIMRNLILELELRIIELEKLSSNKLPNAPDGWYFDY